MKPERPSQAAILEFGEVVFNSGTARFDLDLLPGDLALFELGETVPLSWLGDAALGLVTPVGGEVRFRGMAWERQPIGEAERCRRSVGRVWAPEEEATWLQNLDVDENIQLAQQFDPRQSHAEVSNRLISVAKRFGMNELPKMRPAGAKRRTLQVAQWVRAFLPKQLDLLILDMPLRGAEDEDALLLLQNVAEARARGVAVLWMEKSGTGWRDRGVEPTWHFPQCPAALLPEAVS